MIDEKIPLPEGVTEEEMCKLVEAKIRAAEKVFNIQKTINDALRMMREAEAKRLSQLRFENKIKNWDLKR